MKSFLLPLTVIDLFTFWVLQSDFCLHINIIPYNTVQYAKKTHTPTALFNQFSENKTKIDTVPCKKKFFFSFFFSSIFFFWLQPATKKFLQYYNIKTIYIIPSQKYNKKIQMPCLFLPATSTCSTLFLDIIPTVLCVLYFTLRFIFYLAFYIFTLPTYFIFILFTILLLPFSFLPFPLLRGGTPQFSIIFTQFWQIPTKSSKFWYQLHNY